MFCDKCGSKVNDNATYCPVCNAKIDKNKQQKNYSNYKPHTNYIKIIIAVIIIAIIGYNVYGYIDTSKNIYKDNPNLLAADVYDKANVYLIDKMANGEYVSEITIDDLIEAKLITKPVWHDVEIIVNDQYVYSVIVDDNITYPNDTDVQSAIDNQDINNDFNNDFDNDYTATLDNSDDSGNAETANISDLNFLINDASYSIAEVENYDGFEVEDSYCNDLDQIEYDLFQAQQCGSDTEELYEDDNYRIISTNGDIYVYNKSISSDMPQQSIGDHNHTATSLIKTFYRGEYLYLCFNPIEADLEHYYLDGERYAGYYDWIYVLVVESNKLTNLDGAIFSDNYSYICYPNGDNLYIINTDTFFMYKIMDVEPEPYSHMVISNNGTVIYCRDNEMYIKYINNSNLYHLQQNFKPIYINNESQALFIETKLGIKKLTASGEEWVFKYTGFDNNVDLYYGVEKGITSPIVDAVGNHNNIKQTIDLTQY